MKCFNIVAQNVDAVKRLSRSESEILKAEINSYDPAYVFTVAKESRNPDKRYIICPNCGNGSGSDKTPVEVNRVGNVWLYHCFKCDSFTGDLLKIIATENNLNLNNVEDFCKALAVGADIIGYNFDKHEKPKSNMQLVYNSKQSREVENLILADIADAREHLMELPETQRRGLSLETLQHFGVGYIAKWVHPKKRLDDKNVPPSRRIIIPAGNHYNAVALTADRPGMPKNFHKMHAGTMELFNSRVIQFADVVFVVEGEFDAMSIWQASKIAVVAVLGAANWRKTFAPYFETCTGKKCIILFDDDDAGKKNSENLRGELIKNNIPAVSKFLYDYLSDADKELFGVKVDANQILQERGNSFLQNLIDKIIFDARADFETVEEEIAAQKEQNRAEKFNGYDFLQDSNFDLDNARRLEKFCGNHIRWLTDDERWLLYNQGIWLRRSEKNSCLYPVAEKFADEMLHFAKILADKFQTLTAPTVIHEKFADKTPEEKIYDKAKADKDKAFDVAGYFKQRKNYSAAIDLMKGCSSILITADDLNKNKNLLACQNGVIDLQTGKLYAFAPELLITNQVAAFYDLQADTSFVEKFFAEVLPDEPTCRAVLRYLGYCLTGEKNFHISQFWRGSGANGKSTILDALIRLLASYAVKLPCAALLESNMPINANGATPALALLDGDIRLALIDELPRNSRLNAALYKTITGDETIAARPLYGNFRNIQLRAKLILNGNHLPTFDVDDGGLQRRITNVEFTQKFEGGRADSDLPKKLATPQNRSALLKILVEEAKLYYKEDLLESDAMKAAKAAYFAESDFISEFVDDFCDIGDGFILRKEFIDKLKAEHFADTRRFSSQELFKAVCSSLARNGVVYTKDRLKNNIFKGIRWQGNTLCDGKIISSNDYAMP